MMPTAWAFLKRDFLIATSYKLAFAQQLLQILALVPIFFYLSRLVPDSKVTGLEIEGSYFAHVLVGMAFWDYLRVSLRTFEESLRESQLMGTLEIMILSPTALARILIYSSLWVYLFSTIRFAMYLLLGLAFGLNLGQANTVSALVILLLTIPGFAGIGILTASVTVIAKRGLGLNAIMAVASMFFGGVLFPAKVLPDWLEAVSRFIPMTHALEGMRSALFQGLPTAELLPQIVTLAVFAVVLVPGGLLSFWAAIRWTKVTGTLAQY
jgi:ABC-2 type transport system permease protein